MATGPQEPYDHESVYEPPQQLGGPVDPPDQRAPAFIAVVHRDADRRPIVPAALRSRDQRRALAGWALGFAGHSLAYHLTRSPKYLGKVAVWAPVGAWRTTKMFTSWAFDLEGFGARQHTATNNAIDDYLKLSRQRDARVGWRGWIYFPVIVVTLIAMFLLVELAPGWVQLVAAVLVLPVLARIGRPVGKPIMDRVSTPQGYRKLTAEMTRKALVATGLVKLKDTALITFPREIYRDGPGYTAITDLPDGVIATDILDKREYYAAGFRLPMDQVWPETLPGEHPGRLCTWVADKPVSSMKQPPWPLLKEGQVDYFKPYPYGWDPRQRSIPWQFDERNSLFGGVPGSGKSVAARVLMLAAVLDPLVIPAVAEFKGSGDFDAIEPLCPEDLYHTGADEGTKRKGMQVLDWLLDECERRGPLIKEYARQGLNNENKLNRAMAEFDERLRPIVAMFDEVQHLFTCPDLGKEAVAKATSVIKRGRSLGIHLILATQRIDAPSVPKGISSNVVMRLALAVTSHVECDLILGTGAYGRGARPTAFEPGVDAGWGYRVGMGPMAPVRACYLDNHDAAAIAQRALAMRGGVTVETRASTRANARNLLHDVRRVWPPGEQALWSELIVPLLKTLAPDLYGDLTVEIFGQWMAAAGVRTVQLGRRINGKPHTRAGVRLEVLDAKIKAEEIGR
jgi:S-DNA-T family DNA segregation ATPase FtsK/SpoIIIE